MVTEKDLLLNEIQIPKTEGKVEMALPPDVKQADKKKKHGLISMPLFRESLHSNRLGLTVVSLGNALIMIIIIGILSTLRINSTADALKDLFSNADMENTIKSGAISLYSTYYESANGYQTFIDSNGQVVKLVNTCIDEVEDTKLNTAINTAKTGYDLAYAIASRNSTPEVSHQTSKKTTMDIVNTTLNNDASMTEQEKEVASGIISSYLDYHFQDKNASVRDILIQVIPEVLSDQAGKEMGLDEDDKKAVKNSFDEAMKKVYTDNEDKKQVAVEQSFALLPLLASDDQKEFVTDTVDDLKTKYLEDKTAYLNDPSIYKTVIADDVSLFVMKNLEEFAYYQYLPNFTVNYKTNDLGYPITLVPSGRYSDNGNEIMEEKAISVYNPDVFIKVDEKMGTTSNMLEKMHKEAITGEDYTEEEYNQAKEDSKDDIDNIQNHLDSFMKTYLKNDLSGNNIYYDSASKEVDKDEIVSLSVSQVEKMATKTLIDAYNDKNDVKITSLEEINSKNSSMSGKDALSAVRGYAVSGIASYQDYYNLSLSENYSKKDSLLLSMNKASLGVIAQLPTSVDESLKEMGDMNTYGIIVGVVAFGIAALLIPMVYTILLAKSLVSEKVETGSLAFTLSTPTTRDSFIFTEGVYLLFSEVVMGVALLLGALLTRTIGILAGSTDLVVSLPVEHILAYSFGNFMVTVAISGICFLSSCYFNKTSQAIGVGGGLTIFFFICSILGLFATKAIPGTIRINMMNLFNYMTIDSLFDALAVMSGDWLVYWMKLLGLLLIAVVTYIIGGILFKKKDLPL